MDSNKRKRSVPSPLYRSLYSPNEHVPPQTTPDPVTKFERAALALIERLHGRFKLLAIAQVALSCRVSEVLSLRAGDIAPSGLCIVRARKGSQTRVGFCPQLLPYVSLDDRRNNRKIFGSISYGQYRRALIEAGARDIEDSGARRAITNIFRRLAARTAARLSEGDLQCARHTLGHKSAVNTLTYIEGSL